MMRKRFFAGLIASLVALFSITPSAGAQHNRLPPCGDSALAALAEIQPAFETLIADPPSTSYRFRFVPYIEAYFGWREGLWAQLPRCAEMLEIAVLMDHIASNLIAIPALNAALMKAGRPIESNPYTAQDYGEDSLASQLERQIEAVAARLSEDGRVTPEAPDLPACADDDYDIFYANVYDPYIDLIQTIARGRSIETALLIAEAVLAWRGEVWHGLPACAGMIEITWPMAQAASDFAVFGALNLALMKPEADRFNDQVARNGAAIAEMTPAFLGQAAPDAQLPESGLPGCARSQLLIFNDIILEYAGLVNATEDIASLDDVYAFGQRQYEWREKRLADLPRCAEAFELGLLIDQATGDIVIALALLFAGIDAGDIPHREAIQAGTAKMSALVTPVLQGERAGTDSPMPGPLPQCSDAQLGLITAEIEPEFWELYTADTLVETIEDLLAVGEMQIAFREGIWRRLPACADAYDIAWLMYRISGDSVTTWALLVAGAAEEDIAFSATAQDMNRLDEMLNAIGDASAGSDG